MLRDVVGGAEEVSLYYEVRLNYSCVPPRV